MVSPAIAVDACTHSGVSQDRRRKSRSQTPARAPNGDRSGSWVLPAPNGAYAALTAWTSAERWFDALLDALGTDAGETVRRQWKVGRDTLLRIAYADRRAADQLTGRNVCTAHETVAEQLGMAAKTVYRARRLLEALGLAVTVVEGRYLFGAEREAAHAAHGGQQVRAASTRALVMPSSPSVDIATNDPSAVENVYLPGSRREHRSVTSREWSPTRAQTRAPKAAAPRRPANDKDVRSPTPPKPRSFAAQQLAGRLVQRMPWITAGRHIGHVVDAVQRHHLDTREWTADEILRRVDAHARDTGIYRPDPIDQRSPLGYLFWQIRRAIDPDELPPSRQLTQDRQNAAARAAARAADDAERRSRADADQDAIYNVIREMRAQFPRRQPRSTH